MSCLIWFPNHACHYQLFSGGGGGGLFVTLELFTTHLRGIADSKKILEGNGRSSFISTFGTSPYYYVDALSTPCIPLHRSGSITVLLTLLPHPNKTVRWLSSLHFQTQQNSKFVNDHVVCLNNVFFHYNKSDLFSTSNCPLLPLHFHPLAK